MCDTYVPDVGYICPSCQSEFKDYIVEKGITVTTDREIRATLKEFMETRKGDFIDGPAKDVDDFFNEHTR